MDRDLGLRPEEVQQDAVDLVGVCLKEAVRTALDRDEERKERRPHAQKITPNALERTPLFRCVPHVHR